MLKNLFFTLQTYRINNFKKFTSFKLALNSQVIQTIMHLKILL